MKKFIFGCMLMVLGTIGGTGWLIAYVITSGTNRWPTLLDSFPVIGIGCKESYVVIGFYCVSIIGFVFSLLHINEIEKNSWWYV